MDWLLWGMLLFAQTGSNTWVSRARNSSSIAYHAAASVVANGVWLLQLMVSINKLASIQSLVDGAVIVMFYIACTVAGAVSMHWFSMRYLERGIRKVGS